MTYSVPGSSALALRPLVSLPLFPLRAVTPQSPRQASSVARVGSRDLDEAQSPVTE